MRGTSWLALLIVAVSTVACSYEGDGKLTDEGIGTAHERYVLDLGRVDLASTWRREYVMANLPSEEFTFGLRLAGTKWDKSTVRAKVRLILMNEKGEIVFDVAETLQNWVWSGPSDREPFLYLRGVQKEVPIGQGTVRLEPIGVRADGGWGTYVSARHKGRYRLLYETIAPDPKASQVTATLVAVGGGWK